MSYFIFIFPVLFLVFALFYGFISFSILLRKKPVILNSNWLTLLIGISFLPIIVINLSQFDPSRSNAFITLGIPVLFVLLFGFYFFFLKGYSIYGVKDDDFRTALFDSLNSLNLRFSESLGKILLSDVPATLSISLQSWVGTGMIKIDKGQNLLLSQIIASLRTRFQDAPVAPKKTAAYFYLAFSVFFLAMTVFFSFYLAGRLVS